MMNDKDPLHSFIREHRSLEDEWTRFYALYQNAHRDVINALIQMDSGDQRLNSAHNNIVREKEFLGKLQDVQDQIMAALNRVDEAINGAPHTSQR